MRTKLISIVAAIITLASCQQDETADNTLPVGKYPLEIASVAIGVEGGDAQPWGAKTRVAETSATECSWTDGDKISVKVSGNGNDMETVCTLDANGNVTEYNPVCYWQNAKSSTVTAWCVRNATDETSTTGATTVDLSDQSKGLAYVLKAEVSGSYASPVKLEFAHQLAKVRVKISDSELIPTPSEVSVLGYPKCTVSDGTVTASGTQTYIPMHKETYSDGTTYYEACLVPDESLQENAIKIVSGGYTLVANLDKTVTLAAGSMHDMEISVASAVTQCDLSELTETYTISKNGLYYVTGSNADNEYGITVTGGNPTIILNNATITRSGNGISGTSYTLYLKGTNSVTSGMNSAITVSEDNTLTIDGEGSLTAKGGYYGAGIGGGYVEDNNLPCGNITINGGTVNATGGTYNGAGIGGGCQSSCGDITINGGTVNATANMSGAGIGGGSQSSCGDITINGGEVHATAGSFEAGIGGGTSYSPCRDIAISGGIVYATGGTYGGAGIGGGCDSSCGNIIISGGTVYATYGTNTSWHGGAGIGGGTDESPCDNIIISGGTVTATGGTKCSNSSNRGDDVGNGYNNSDCTGTITITNVTVLDKDGNEATVTGMSQ